MSDLKFDPANINQARVEGHKHCKALLPGFWKDVGVAAIGCEAVRCAAH